MKEAPEIENIRIDLDLNGLIKGTQKYEAAFIERRVEKCKELRGESSCFECKAFGECNLIRQHLMNVRYGIERN